MKASDIQIGDWVRLRYIDYLTKEEVVKDFQVGQIRYTSWYGRGEDLYVGTDVQNMGRVEQIEPIPITPEILQKSGLGQNGDFGLYDEYFDLTIEEVSDGNYLFRYECTEMNGIPFTQSLISFVHELQQELRKHCIDVEVKL